MPDLVNLETTEKYSVVSEGIASLKDFFDAFKSKASVSAKNAGADKEELKSIESSVRLAPYFSRGKVQTSQAGDDYQPLVMFFSRDLSAKEQEKTGRKIEREIIRISRSIENRIKEAYASYGLQLPEEVEEPLISQISFPTTGKEFTRLLTSEKDVRRTVSVNNETAEQTTFYQVIDRRLTEDALEF